MRYLLMIEPVLNGLTPSVAQVSKIAFLQFSVTTPPPPPPPFFFSLITDRTYFLLTPKEL